jgi:hypothetical protein
VGTASGYRGEFQGREDKDESPGNSKQGQCFAISVKDFFQLVNAENQAWQCYYPPDNRPIQWQETFHDVHRNDLNISCFKTNLFVLYLFLA